MTSRLSISLPWLSALGRLIWPEGPSGRKRWVLLGGSLLLAFLAQTLWMAIASVRLVSATQAITAEWGALTPSSLAPPPVADGDNAARAVRAAGEMLILPAETPGQERAVSVRGYGSFKQHEPSPDERAVLHRIVADNAEASHLLDAAVLRPRASWNLGYAMGVATEIPDLRRLVELARLHIAAGRLAVEEGRDDEVVRALARVGVIERSLANEPILIVQVTRASLQRLQLALLRQWLGSQAPSGADLTGAAATLGEPSTFALRDAFIAEAKMVIEALLDGDGVELPVSTGGTALSLGLTWLARPLVLDNARAYLGYMNQAAACAEAPRYQRPGWCAAPEPLGRYHFLAQIAAVDIAGLMQRSDLAASRAVLALLALALEHRRLEQGCYPASLDGLDDSLRLDPLTGGPFFYESREDGYHLASQVWLDAQRGGPPLLDALDSGDPVLNWDVQRAGAGN